MIDTNKYLDTKLSARQLADSFCKDYFGEKEIQYPINPFQILTDLKVPYMFRPFKNYEGIYIPAKDAAEFPIVGINLKKPITRQRYTAAHEICHHLKDSNKGFVCTSKHTAGNIERYAEHFAAELLMPLEEIKKQAEARQINGTVSADAILEIADFFGVSFKACLNRIAYLLHMVEGDTSPESLRKLATDFKPQLKREERGMTEIKLYDQLFDASGEWFDIEPSEFACHKFKNEYIYFDSRMEGIQLSLEEVSDIVTDLRVKKQESEYCTETNREIIEVAGLTFAYDYVFEESESSHSICDIKMINAKLYSTAPFPDVGGTYRDTDTLVLGAKFETTNYRDIPTAMMELDREIEFIDEKMTQMSNSEYIKALVRIHHRLTVIHAFRDGNGRTARAFFNMMILKKHLPPVFFKDKTKAQYKEALAEADHTGNYDRLYQVFYKAILSSTVQLSDYIRPLQ